MDAEKPPVLSQYYRGQLDLQARLDHALFRLNDARRQKSDRGCAGSIGLLASFVPLVAGFALFSQIELFPTAALLELVAAAGFVLSVQSLLFRPPSLEVAARELREVADQVTGDEFLSIDTVDREALHNLLYSAQPRLAMALLRLLAVCGNEGSLWFARSMTGMNAHLFAAGDDAEVRQVAVWSSRQIVQRIQLARQASSLLRPAAPTGDSELLRPAVSGGADESLLLRAEPEDG
jgi:hypothetical protein